MTDLNIAFMSADDVAALAFAQVGCNVLIDTSARIVGVENVKIGDHVRIDANVIIVASGPVSIGSYVHVGANCYLEGRGGLTIEDFANLSSYVSLHSVSDDFSGGSLTNPMTPDAYKTLDQRPILIGRHVAIGTKSTVLPGVSMGEGAVLGAHSLARGDCTEWSMNVGVPARHVGERSRDLLDLEQQFLREQGR
jgi:acetyltransferase-like isoleucine patch superfamily enzyme